MPALSRRALPIGIIVAAGALSLTLLCTLGTRIDAGAVRGSLPADSRDTFDLLMALRAPRGGAPDWARAEQLCGQLAWPRCDRMALEVLQERSRGLFAGKDPPAAAALAVADAIWAFGSEAAARAMFRTELDRVPESDGPRRARVFLRFGIIDTNPDGQAALFNQACTADPSICDHMKEAAWREVQGRFVPPGNVLPLYFSNGRGHPRISAPR